MVFTARQTLFGEFKMDGACSTVGERRVAERIVVERLDGKRPLGRHRNKWKDRVKEEFGNMTEWP